MTCNIAGLALSCANGYILINGACQTCVNSNYACVQSCLTSGAYTVTTVAVNSMNNILGTKYFLKD